MTCDNCGKPVMQQQEDCTWHCPCCGYNSSAYDGE